MSKYDVHEEITSRIVAAIENGAGAFEMPWHRAAASAIGRPHNPVGKYAYHGVNTLALWVAQQAEGYPSAQWATYRQWQAAGAQVRKGERGTLSVFMKRFDRETVGDDGETETQSLLVARGNHVFNAAQVDGWSAETIARPALVDRLEHAESYVARTGAVVRHGGERAFYSPGADFIAMPPRETFRDTSTRTATEGYYAVLAHELTHWTGHGSRCARDFSGRFGDDAYAAEELVAELGAAFLCADLGITNEPRPDHARYVGSWLTVLQNDKRAIFTAASKAQGAVEYLDGLQLAEPERAAA